MQGCDLPTDCATKLLDEGGNQRQPGSLVGPRGSATSVVRAAGGGSAVLSASSRAECHHHAPARAIRRHIGTGLLPSGMPMIPMLPRPHPGLASVTSASSAAAPGRASTDGPEPRSAPSGDRGTLPSSKNDDAVAPDQGYAILSRCVT